MIDHGAVLAPVSRFERAILEFPDQKTTWAVLVAASLREPLHDLEARLATLSAAAPMIAARFAGHEWRRGDLPPVLVADSDPVVSPALAARFDLEHEPPLRVLVGATGRRVALAGHHAAFDGLALVAVLAGLLGEPVPGRAEPPPRGRTDGLLPLVRRALHPASRVAPSSPRPTVEARIARTARLDGDAVTARIAAAAAAAAAAHNAGHGAPWRRIGISVGIRGPAGIGNVCTYRRIDTPPGGDVAGVVAQAIGRGAEPLLFQRSPRIASVVRPVVARLSDSLLVSNLGRQRIPGAESVEFYPVARGRSAVALGAVGLVDGTSTVTLRARDLAADEAATLLDHVIARLAR